MLPLSRGKRQALLTETISLEILGYTEQAETECPHVIACLCSRSGTGAGSQGRSGMAHLLPWVRRRRRIHRYHRMFSPWKFSCVGRVQVSWKRFVCCERTQCLSVWNRGYVGDEGFVTERKDVRRFVDDREFGIANHWSPKLPMESRGRTPFTISLVLLIALYYWLGRLTSALGERIPNVSLVLIQLGNNRL